MTEDQQSLYDQFEHYNELAADAISSAEEYETAARQQRQLAAQYKEQARALARQLGFIQS